MAEVNASIPTSIKPPEFDPLAAATKAQALGTGMLQNRLLGQQVRAKEALGRAVTAATDPATGKTDWNKALGTLAQDPQGSFGVPELAGQVLDRQMKELQLDEQALKLSSQRWAKVGDTTAALLGSREPLTRQGVIKTLSDQLVGSGLFNDEASVGQLVNLVQNLPEDDAGLRRILKGVALQSNMTTERINALMGTPTVVDTGGQVVTQQVSPLTGEMTVPAAIEKGRTPSEKAQLVQVYDPATKTMKMVPSGTLLGDDAPGTRGDAGPVAQAGPALGQSEAFAQAAGDSAKQFTDLTVTADQVPTRVAALKNLRDQVSKFSAGAKTDWIYAAKALATQLGVAPPQMRDQVAAQEEFNKLATQFINQQIGTLGGTGTDAKLESAAKGSPNEFMSKEGILGVTALMLGNEDAIVAKNMAAQKWMAAGNGPETYPQFAAQFNKYFNPRVFQSQYMSEGQKTQMLKNMTPKEREQFQRDWTFAKKAGWIK